MSVAQITLLEGSIPQKSENPERIGNKHRFYTLKGTKQLCTIDIIPDRVYNYVMNKIAEFIKQKRKEARLTQEEFAIRSGLGLRFVRELEQGKATVRMDKVNQALAMFGMEAVPGEKEREKLD